MYNTTNLQVFNYGNNNPIKYNDPDGRVAVVDDATVAVVAAGLLLAAGVISIANNRSYKDAVSDLASQAGELGKNIIDGTIEAGNWIGEKIAGLFSKGDKEKPKTKDKTGDENSNQAKDIDLGDVSIWTKPPGDGDFHEGEPSREKPKNRGEKAFMMKMVVNGEFINLINIIQKCIGTINRR